MHTHFSPERGTVTAIRPFDMVFLYKKSQKLTQNLHRREPHSKVIFSQRELISGSFATTDYDIKGG